jgi:hypothetical protein
MIGSAGTRNRISVAGGSGVENRSSGPDISGAGNRFPPHRTLGREPTIGVGNIYDTYEAAGRIPIAAASTVIHGRGTDPFRRIPRAFGKSSKPIRDSCKFAAERGTRLLLRARQFLRTSAI